MSDRRRRWQVGFAGAAVLLAAADTYVVVVALPSIMTSVGLGVDRLQRATPIITGFLLGYIAILPLLGRLADLYGRTPVFVGCLVAFAVGSVITATAHSLSVVVVGRALQGLGGGGLVPVTLSLVAALWPPEQRAVPLGAVGAVQELGSVLGPLYGAVLVSVSGWRTIFWVNIPVAAAVGVAFVLAGRSVTHAPTGPTEGTGSTPRSSSRADRPDVVGAILLILGAAGAVLALWAPPALADDVSFGRLYEPMIAGPTWSAFTTPMAFISLVLLVGFVVWEVWAPWRVRPLVPLRRLPELLAAVDVIGALLLAGVLACVVVAFSTADPSRQVVAASAPILAPVAIVLALGFFVRERRTAVPLVPLGSLRQRQAWGALVVNFAVGSALMAGLVDVPFFARLTRYPNSQIGAALVLLRLLAAIPVGAVIGGLLSRRWSRSATAASGMALAAIGFGFMARWTSTALDAPIRVAGLRLPVHGSDLALIVCGLGFGLVIAPINAVLLEGVNPNVHGVVSALSVVARMVGMLVGLSVLTAIGLRRFYRAEGRVRSPLLLCPNHPGSCAIYNRAVDHAALGELHTIFAGACVCAVVAGILALGLLRTPRSRTSLATTVVG